MNKNGVIVTDYDKDLLSEVHRKMLKLWGLREDSGVLILYGVILDAESKDIISRLTYHASFIKDPEELTLILDKAVSEGMK